MSSNGAILFEFDQAVRDREQEIAVRRTIQTPHVHHESTVIVPFGADYFDQAPLQNLPAIVSIAPLGRRPSESIHIYGDHFDVFDGRSGCTVYLTAMDDPDGFSTHINVAAAHSSNDWSALLVSTTEIELRLGLNIPAGRYAVSVGNGSGFSNTDVYQVAPWTYQVNLVEFRCIDESNEASASDEIVTFWAAAADAEVHSGNTDEYEGVDAGGTYAYRQQERRLFGPFWKPIQRAITVVIKLSEWDAGVPPGSKRVEPKDAGGQIIVLLGWVAVIPKLQVIALVAIAVIALIDALMSLDDEPDPLGSAELLLTAEELLLFTMNNERRHTRVLGFINADSEGSHLVTLEFLRGA